MNGWNTIISLLGQVWPIFRGYAWLFVLGSVSHITQLYRGLYYPVIYIYRGIMISHEIRIPSSQPGFHGMSFQGFHHFSPGKLCDHQRITFIIIHPSDFFHHEHPTISRWNGKTFRWAVWLPGIKIFVSSLEIQDPRFLFTWKLLFKNSLPHEQLTFITWKLSHNFSPLWKLPGFSSLFHRGDVWSDSRSAKGRSMAWLKKLEMDGWNGWRGIS